jgi:hypothetical protein
MGKIRFVLNIKWGFYWTDADKNKIHLTQHLNGICPDVICRRKEASHLLLMGSIL